LVGGLSAGCSPQPGYSQLSNQIPRCTPCPSSALDMVHVDQCLPDEKPGCRAKAFPTVCKRMHEHELRKSKLNRSVANTRNASDANTCAALRQTIAVSFASAGRAKAGTIGRSRLSSVGLLAGTMGNPSLMAREYIAGSQTVEQHLRRSAFKCSYQGTLREPPHECAQFCVRNFEAKVLLVYVVNSDRNSMRGEGKLLRSQADCSRIPCPAQMT
jgi:hypothetical protein